VPFIVLPDIVNTYILHQFYFFCDFFRFPSYSLICLLLFFQHQSRKKIRGRTGQYTHTHTYTHTQSRVVPRVYRGVVAGVSVLVGVNVCVAFLALWGN
jgi:hypothetical protein